MDPFSGDEWVSLFAAELVALLEGHTPYSAEFPEKKITNEHFYFIVNVILMPGCEDNWSRVIVASTDITEWKHTQEELNTAKEAAESMALQAEKANQARSRFLSHMSHELRTPLSVILGFSDLLRGQTFGKINEKQFDYLSKIEEAGRHLLSLINDLLDLSKIDAGQMVMESVMFQPENLIDSVVSLMRIQFSKKRHSARKDR